MGIFDRIKDAIFGRAEASPAPGGSSPMPPIPGGPVAMPPPVQIDPAPTAGNAPTPAPSGGPVDVAAVLDAAVKSKKRKLNWRTSIVDLLKALDLDSSLANRRELANELGYSGSKKTSEMNMWLHKQVLAKLKANGGKVPAELL
jgi:hypothetical protein